MTDDLIGKQVGGYEVIDKLGQGGMATVYRARQNSMNRTVALKILPLHFMRDDTYLKRFEREVAIIAQLEHRNIVPVYDYGEYNGQPYIAMRYMPAGSVDDLLRRGPLPLDTALSIVQQIAPALDYAHSKSVLHRDLKPSNILMDDDGGAYITDFGIARIVGAENHGNTITTQGVVGTPSYMSPEQAQGKDLDGRSDIYSMGVMLFEMLTGQRPFQNDTPYGIAIMQVTTPPPSPRTLNPKITAAIETITLKSLKKKPENRYQTAVQLSEAFKLAIERPDSVHDTQPRSLPVKEALELTQPSQLDQQYTVPSSSIQAVPPAYTPPPPPPPSSQMRPLRRVNKRRGGNMWISIILGGLIGCALLTVIIVLVLTTLNDLFSTAQPTATPTSDESEIIVGPIGTAIQPTAPPELSNKIVFFAGKDTLFNIFTYNLDSGNVEQLTQETATTSYPQMSPDGTRIVFQSFRDGDFEIYVMDLNNSNITQLTHNTIFDRLPSWSPDSEWIVYSADVREDGRYDLFRISAEGGDPERIYSDGQRNSHPRYSGDGRYVVFTSGDSGDGAKWEIARLDLMTGNVKLLTSNNVRDASPSFSPDDSKVIYVTGIGGTGIATLDMTTNEETIIYEGSDFITGVSYSPEGSRIVFDSQPINGDPKLFIMNADGSDLRELGASSGLYPSFIP